MTTSEIPDRLSVDDADFDPELGRSLAVSLDGVLQAFVISYDIPGGEIVRCRQNDEGEIYVDPHDPEAIAIETVRGEVTVTICDHSGTDGET